METQAKILLLRAPGREFVRPYIEAQMPEWQVVETCERPDAAVMLSGTEIYEPSEGEDLDEGTPVNENCPLAEAERRFADECRGAGMSVRILRCANTLGTGMTGYVRALAESIYRGAFFHFPDNEARLSVVHAADVARVVNTLVANDKAVGVFNLTDESNPTLHDLAEAIAFRMNEKRISNASTFGQKWLAKLFYGAKRYRQYTTTLTFSGKAVRELVGVEPLVATEYLRTHVYDENSL